jgi:hypothetical protein
VRYIPFVIQLALMIYALIDCIQTDSVLVRNLPKPLWVFLIVVLPLVGPIVWLVAGRPQRASSGAGAPWPSTATAGFPEYERPRAARGPDDDDAFLESMRASDREHEEMLRDWEQQLRAREAALGSEVASEMAPSADDDTTGGADAGDAEDGGRTV